MKIHLFTLRVHIHLAPIYSWCVTIHASYNPDYIRAFSHCGANEIYYKIKTATVKVHSHQAKRKAKANYQIS